jgi:hypothetical protein
MNTLRNRNQLQPATNAEVRRAEERAEAILVQEGIQLFLDPKNASYEQIIGMNDFHVVPKNNPTEDKAAIEARANLIADRKSADSRFWKSPEHTQGGDLTIRPEFKVSKSAMGQVIEVDFVSDSQNVVVHTPAQAEVA